MKTSLPLPRSRSMRVPGAVALLSICCGLAAEQRPPSSVDVQREAMQKLKFLSGRWSGPVTVVRGSGDSLHLSQTENVQFRLDGLVVLIEGQGTAPDGTTQFQALATIAYDDTSQTYRFRAYNDGHYLDTELSVLPDGFQWGVNSGPAHIQNTMHLTANGEWQETTEVAFGTNPPRRSVEMLLKHQP